MSYKVHYVVDGGKARVILTALATRADVKDNQPMLDLLWHTTFRWKLRPHHVTGDSVYGTIPNLKGVENAGIRAYMPAIDYTWGKRTLFRKDDFTYDAQRDVYICPAGELLRNTGARKKLRLTRYVAEPEICNACTLKSKCTEGKSGRAVNRNFDEEYFEKVKGYYGLEAYKKAMRKRKVWIEPMFAEAKQWHGMREVRLRTLERVNAEVLIVASGQNIKRLLEFGFRGPRRVAQAAALRPPETSHSQPAWHHRATRPHVSQRAARNHAMPPAGAFLWAALAKLGEPDPKKVAKEHASAERHAMIEQMHEEHPEISIERLCSLHEDGLHGSVSGRGCPPTVAEAAILRYVLAKKRQSPGTAGSRPRPPSPNGRPRGPASSRASGPRW